MHQPSILQNQPGWPRGVGRRRRGTPGQVGWVPGRAREKKKGVPGGRGLIVLLGGAQKAHQKRAGGHPRPRLLHQGTVLERARCCHLPTPGTGEPATHKPLAQPHLKQRCQSTLLPRPLSWSPPGQPAASSGHGAQLTPYSSAIGCRPQTSGLRSHGKGRVGMGVRR